MSEASTKFAFKADDLVQFKDGLRTRVAVVISQEVAKDVPNPDGSIAHLPDGYMLMFRIADKNQPIKNVTARWAADDVQAAGAPVFAFRIKDAVTVLGSDDIAGISGVVVERTPISKGALEPHYGVMFKAADGRGDMAWWGESHLVAAAPA
jgi:hypothetical protein